MSVLEIKTYVPYEKQREFHSNGAKFRLFGGARGPGKSRAILEEGISVCNFQPDGKGGSTYRADGTGLNAIILRTSLTDLEGSVISKFKESDWFRKEYVSYSDQKKLVTFPNGATLKFGYGANKQDLAQYLGQEYAFVGWDELGLVADYKMFIDMAGSLRCPLPSFKNGSEIARMCGSANPGGPGHAWLRAMFVNGLPAPGMEPHQYKRELYAYIPATYVDGPYRNDKAYLENLMMQPLAVQKAWILGSWDFVAGAYFSCWSTIEFAGDEKNAPTIDMTFDPLWLEKRRQNWWSVWISVDWGFQHHAAVYWHTMDSKGNVYTFKEMVVRKQGSKALAHSIIENSRDILDAKGSIDYIYLSPDAKQKHDYDANSIKQQMDAVLLQSELPCTTIASDDRKAGWLLMYQLLDAGEWKIGRNCREAIAGIPTLMVNPANVEDVLKADCIADDVGDALRYGIFSRLKDRSMKPKHVEREETLAAITDIQSKYMTDLRMKAKEADRQTKIGQIGRIPGWQQKLEMRRRRAARAQQEWIKEITNVDKQS